MKKRTVILGVVLIGWVVFIFLLSSQTGTQTAETSAGMAEKLAVMVYRTPTNQQINEVHLVLRKVAHIGLFFVLGALSLTAMATLFQTKQKVISRLAVSISMIMVIGYGFFDEWHKQFIDGRHFDMDEAALNIVSGSLGVLVASIILLAIYKYRARSHPQISDVISSNSCKQ